MRSKQTKDPQTSAESKIHGADKTCETDKADEIDGVDKIDETDKENKEGDPLNNPFSLVRGREVLRALKGASSEKLKELLQIHPEISYVVYEDILLQEKDLIKGLEESYRENRLLDSPKSPVSQWKEDILGFTRLNVEISRRLSCILRGRAQEVRETEILEILRKLEYICTGKGFSIREKELSASLLSVSVGSIRISSQYSIYLCGFLYLVKYPFAREILLKHLEMRPSAEEILLYIRRKGVSYSWILLGYLSKFPEKTEEIFEGVKEEIPSLLQENEEDLVNLLKPIYIYSTDALEEKIRTQLKENHPRIIRKCQERIWD